MEELHDLVNNTTISGQGENSWIWLEDQCSKFSDKSAYVALHKMRIGSQHIDILKKF